MVHNLIIGVTSKSQIKLGAVSAAYSEFTRNFNVGGYPTISGVGEQPVNAQTEIGARN